MMGNSGSLQAAARRPVKSGRRHATRGSPGSALVVAGTFAMTLSAGALVHAHSDSPHDATTAEPVILAPGYEKLTFAAPEPGSYSLPVLGNAGDGQVVTSHGKDTDLHEVMRGKISVLSFIYQACNDVNGCPLATYVLHQVRQTLQTDPALHEQVQMLSLSFDPDNDTPSSMQAYRESFGDSPVDWQFLTTRSIAALDPILAAYDQSLSRQKPLAASSDLSGGNTANLLSASTQINHVLRVYLVDASLQIRNIFSSSLLHADTLVSDIRTLLLEASTTNSQQAANTPADASAERERPVNRRVVDPADRKPLTRAVALGGATDSLSLRTNDLRAGYAAGTYTSDTRGLMRKGAPADLLQHANRPALGLPQLPGSEAMTRASISLGRQLFFDRRLSINNTISCAMCHVPQQGFTVNELATAVGVEGRTVKRNAPSLLNVGFLGKLFHEGRESRLEQQAWSPLLAHNEMANPSIGLVLDKVASIDGYRMGFLEAFGQERPTMETLGKALADYQRSLVAGNSAFDRWRYAGDASALSENGKAGYALFTGKAQCSGCHLINEDHALFTDEKAHNTGVGYARSMKRHDEPHPVTLAPGIVVMVDPAVYADAAETPPTDLGLYEITQNPDDRWKFRTPSLRNVALTPPYMHDGSMTALADVIEFYDTGGIANPLLSPRITPLGLSDTERLQLEVFLQSLTSADVAMLVNDGLAVRVGDWSSAE